MSLSILTIGTVNHGAGIRVVLDTFREHHPDAQLFTCLVDGGKAPKEDLALPGVVFSVDDLALPGGRRFAFKFTAFELCCALKPFAAAHVLERYGVERLVYLDSDIMVFSQMEQCLDAAWSTARILCTPHFVEWPNESPDVLRQVRQCGTYNAGFFAVRADPGTRRFLTWWGRMCSEMGTFDLATGRFVDQIWLDLVVADRYGFGTLLDPGMNVGYWNLSERILSKTGATWLANGRPLKFFHFSGFNSHRLTERRTVVPLDVHVSLGRQYDDRLKEAGLERLQDLPYRLGAYQNGFAIPASHRRAIFRNEPTLALVDDPFAATEDAHTWQALTQAALEPPSAPEVSRGFARRIRARAGRAWRSFFPMPLDPRS